MVDATQAFEGVRDQAVAFGEDAMKGAGHTAKNWWGKLTDNFNVESLWKPVVGAVGGYFLGSMTGFDGAGLMGASKNSIKYRYLKQGCRRIRLRLSFS